MKLLYELLSYEYLILTTATDLMINGLTVDTTCDTITLSWVMPEYLPQSYNRDVSCMPACGNLAYITQSFTLGSSETRDHIINLLPGSHCEITLFAVYNPASLDPGLVKTMYTKEKG